MDPYRPPRLSVIVVALFVSLGCLLACPGARAGMMRIILTDGNHVDVPYCWKEKGAIQFEVPGGSAGIPLRYVKKIEEIVASNPFTPEPTRQYTEVYLKAAKKDVDWFKQYLAKQVPAGNHYQKLSDEQVDEIVTRQKTGSLANHRTPQQIYSSSLEIQGKISEWLRLTGDGLMILISNAVSSYQDPTTQRIYVDLYDGNGKLVRRVPCRVQPLPMSPKRKRRLGIKGRLYALVATVPPDPRIMRYEITTVRY